jgi:hypothetical protein
MHTSDFYKTHFLLNVVFSFHVSATTSIGYQPLLLTAKFYPDDAGTRTFYFEKNTKDEPLISSYDVGFLASRPRCS